MTVSDIQVAKSAGTNAEGYHEFDDFDPDQDDPELDPTDE